MLVSTPLRDHSLMGGGTFCPSLTDVRNIHASHSRERHGIEESLSPKKSTPTRVERTMLSRPGPQHSPHFTRCNGKPIALGRAKKKPPNRPAGVQPGRTRQVAACATPHAPPAKGGATHRPKAVPERDFPRASSRVPKASRATFRLASPASASRVSGPFSRH